MIHATDIPLCRRHHRTVHEGRVKVGTSPDGTVLFFTRRGRVLADAPMSTRCVPASLPPVPSAHPGALSGGECPTFSNGAALYRDSAIPWAIEAAAREAMEESLDADR